uniref:X-prolyl aminopeptidase (aminopeptidase P) 2, membrane-bound n=1 Tax=Esox lucius TaxID=8010 RepID=A0AAY5L7T7_ESOLU
MLCLNWLLVGALLALAESWNVVHADDGSERNCSAMPPYLPPTAVNTTQRLRALRETMSSLNVSAYIIPGTDAHLSEYIAQRDARMAFMTGFTGSAGTAVVTQNKAVLWTDSRYWVQAERQMDCNWELKRDVSISSITAWLIQEVADSDGIAFDPFLFSIGKAYSRNLAPANMVLKSLPDNLVDTVWKDRPPVPSDVLIRLPDRIIGVCVCSALISGLIPRRSFFPLWTRPPVRTTPRIPETSHSGLLGKRHLFPLSVSGLFNLRGNDIPYNPFFYSYTLLTLDEIWLFVHKDRVTKEIKDYLNGSCFQANCVQLIEYNQVRKMLSDYLTRPGVKVWIGTEYTNYALYELIEKSLTSDYSPVLTSKAVKDKTEQRILREAHMRDAVAVIQLLMWLEKVVPEGKETEMTAAKFVNECRSKQKENRGPSFETISASGPNAALAHYSPSNETSRKLTVKEMYLVDSGGQYLDGTTDITRTVHWGTPTDMQKEAFTRVLMGNIEISRTIFPSGTRGECINMEMLGRRALWEVGLNYGHGTGHGVGNYFGVHEYLYFMSRCTVFLLEPGYYKENDFGIRIEDVVVTVPAPTKYGHNYLTFETVSLVPYDKKLIDTSLMSPQQLQWLDLYYQTIRRLLVPELDRQGLTEEKEWMLRNTEPLQRSTASAAMSSFSLTFTALATALIHDFI